MQEFAKFIDAIENIGYSNKDEIDTNVSRAFQFSSYELNVKTLIGYFPDNLLEKWCFCFQKI